MEFLKQSLAKLTRLTVEEVTPVLGFFRPIQFPSRQVLLSPGAISKDVWLIARGLLRSYSIIEDTKRTSLQNDVFSTKGLTRWIVPEGRFLTDVRSFLYQTPAQILLKRWKHVICMHCLITTMRNCICSFLF